MDHLCNLGLVVVMGSPAGKVLTSWLLFEIFHCFFVTFPCVILSQVWCLFVSIPDYCPLSYLDCRPFFCSDSVVAVVLSNPCLLLVP